MSQGSWLAKMRAMPMEIPSGLLFAFYAVIAWGLVGVFAAFRMLAGERVGVSILIRVGLLIWLGVPAWLSSRGVFLDFASTPPQLMRVVLPMSLVVFAFVFSPAGKQAARKLPLTLLVGIQAFRLPLEVVLHSLGKHGMIAREMTWAGYNFDIVTGATALLVWGLLRTRSVPRSVVWGFNVLGTGLLVVVVTIAVLGFPAPFGWFTPPNLIVAFFPWCWLPTFLVPLALTGHLLVFRKLLLPEEEAVEASTPS